MDKSSLLQELQILEIAHGIAKNNPRFEKLNLAQQSLINQAYSVYSEFNGSAGLIDDIVSFTDFFGRQDSVYKETRKNLLKELGEPETFTPEQEVSAVPATLEGMMAAYEQNEIDRANLESLDTHPIAEAIKRARATQLILQKARIRAERIKQPDENKFFSKTVDPKTNDRTRSEENVRQTSRILVTSILAEQEIKQSDTANQKIIEQLVDQIESGSIKGYDEIRYVSEIFIKDEYPSFNAEYEEVDKLIREKQKLEEIDPDSDKIEELDRQIARAGKSVVVDPEKYKEKKANLYNNDLDNFTKKAYSDAEYFQEKLSKLIPNPKIPFSQLDPREIFLKKVEKAINLDSPGLLKTPTSTGASNIAPLMSNKTNSKIVDMTGRGLTKEKFNELKSNPNSNLYKLLQENQKVSNRVINAINKIHNSPLYPDVLKGAHDPKISAILNPKAAIENKIKEKLGKHMRREIRKKFGDAASKKVEDFILKNGLQNGIKAFGKAATEKLLGSLAKKLGLEAAKVAASSAIASISAAAGISSGGITLILQAAWFVVTAGLKKIKDTLKETFNISDQDIKEGRNAALVGFGALAASAIAIKKGAKFFGVATKAAAISAVGIIILSIATIAVFLTFTFLTAPILSTLVQLDSTEKVKYDKLSSVEPPKPTLCTNMTWPVKEKCRITQGPKGQYSHSSPEYSESVDIACSSGTDVFSTTDGTVDFVGNSAPYLNTDIIIINSTLANGTQFKVVYAHMSSIEVQKDQIITTGQKLGLSGTAGSGAHLHYEYKDIEYNECPAGDLQLAERCDSSHVPGPNRSCIQELDLGSYLYSN